MGRVRPCDPSLLFVGTLYSDEGILNKSKNILEQNFGDILLSSQPASWQYSDYYKDEIGWPLFRQFIFFKTLIDPGFLADIKLKTNTIEDELSSDGKRRINLDPGYLTLFNIVLASTKNYVHRIYLGKGIYAEVTLIFKDGTYNPHLFTYRDYQDKTCIDIFMNARELLKKMQVNS
ncbi:MAG: hypothetical protein A2Y97_14280 [Nitrospirae bacterium RBG_13_39_12]|nr:MAG: hypothetical protein A2Y97_14280 [Nitrospirae bacterium RBG_13_39_12]